MNAVISKWGNSLGIRIPSIVAKEAGIGLGVPVRVSAVKGRIVVEAIRFDLINLVSAITPENRHEAVDTGRPQGSEAW